MKQDKNNSTMNISTKNAGLLEMIKRRELKILYSEEKSLKDLIAKYEETLNRLKIEELTLSSKVNQARYAMQSHSNTSYSGSNYSRPASRVMQQIACSSESFEHADQLPIEQSSNELDVNQTTLNLEAAPLIQRMLKDTEVYEEEEIEMD